MKTQVVSVGVNPQKPNTWNVKIQMSKLDPPAELKLCVGVSVLKDKTKDSQTPLQI